MAPHQKREHTTGLWWRCWSSLHSENLNGNGRWTLDNIKATVSVHTFCVKGNGREYVRMEHVHRSKLLRLITKRQHRWHTASVRQHVRNFASYQWSTLANAEHRRPCTPLDWTKHVCFCPILLHVVSSVGATFGVRLLDGLSTLPLLAEPKMDSDLTYINRPPTVLMS